MEDRSDTDEPFTQEDIVAMTNAVIWASEPDLKREDLPADRETLVSAQHKLFRIRDSLPYVDGYVWRVTASNLTDVEPCEDSLLMEFRITDLWAFAHGLAAERKRIIHGYPDPKRRPTAHCEWFNHAAARVSAIGREWNMRTFGCIPNGEKTRCDIDPIPLEEDEEYERKLREAARRPASNRSLRERITKAAAALRALKFLEGHPELEEKMRAQRVAIDGAEIERLLGVPSGECLAELEAMSYEADERADWRDQD